MNEYCYFLQKIKTKDGREFLSNHMNDVEANSVHKSTHHALAAYSSDRDSEYKHKTLFFEIFPLPDFKLKKGLKN